MADAEPVLEMEEPKIHKLTICVFGASGDLAKKKTYPALFHLFSQKWIGEGTLIYGFARSQMTDEELRERIRPYLQDVARPGTEQQINTFLAHCTYVQGGYDDDEAFAAFAQRMAADEAQRPGSMPVGRLFYMALPPAVFPIVAKGIKAHCMVQGQDVWNRVVVEKPFGHDLASSEELSEKLAVLFSEDEVYRIDHYLGKELVQNIMMLRFANAPFSAIWSREFVSSVQITFKEPFGTEGRGGYFDKSGIIRDILQNHLLQVMSIVAMEPPVNIAPESIRDEKTRVLQATRVVSLEDTVVGQYAAANGKPGYKDDEGVPNDSVTPTFATCVLHVDNERWQGVPFILKAGKALNERKAEIRLQLKRPAHTPIANPPPNELVIRLQPDEAIYMKINTKTPGLKSHVLESELDLTYRSRYEKLEIPDAYERLILDVIRGDHQHFVRRDELTAAWKIFTPLLHQLEAGAKPPVPYPYGSRGPEESDQLVQRYGYNRSTTYQWKK